jgi:hypothetical protein
MKLNIGNRKQDIAFYLFSLNSYFKNSIFVLLIVMKIHDKKEKYDN